MRRAAAIAAVAMLAAAGCPGAYAGKQSVPDWVTAAAAAPLPAYPDGTRAVVLLDEMVLTVGPDGRAVAHVRRVLKILRPEGREDAVIHAEMDADEKLDSLHAWSIGPDGHQYTMKDSEFVDVGDDEDGMLYVALKARVGRAPGADPGAVVAYEYEQQQRPYMTEATWIYQGDLPVVRSAFELDLPAGWHYYAAWSHHAPVAPTEAAPNHYRWELTNLPAVDLDDVEMAPYASALVARMSVHYSSGELPAENAARWTAVGEWYQKLAGQRGDPSPEITRKAQALVAGQADFYGRLETITAFLQNEIRYVGIEIGVGGWQPHEADDIFRNRYGDCKDKSTLLKAMLDAVGIHSTWVMVDVRRGAIDRAMPSIYGDHMIAAIAIPAGVNDPRMLATVTTADGKRWLIFDPTDQYTPVGQLRPALQGSYGVLVDGGQSELVELPVLKPGTNLLERTGSFTLGADGTLKGTVTETRSGGEALEPRYLYAQGNAKDDRKTMERRLSQDFANFTLDSDTAENVSDRGKDLILRYTVTAPGYARPAGNLLLLRPRVVGALALPLDDKPRKYPIVFGAMHVVRDTYEVRLPAGYVVDETPGPVTLDDGFARYRSAVTVKDGVLTYSRELTVDEQEIPAAKYAELRAFEGRVGADERSTVVLRKQ